MRVFAAAAVLALIGSTVLAADAPTAPPATTLSGQVALLVDLGAGQTLFEKQADKVLLPASMTKAMTTLVAFDLIASGKLREDQLLTVRPQTAAAWSGKGTTLYLQPGAQHSVRELLLGITTASANDASVVLAEGAAGSVAGWTDEMNARARTLGMTRSRFATPNGWPDGGKTFTTARDLVRLGQALVTEHPVLYRRYVGHPVLVWNGAAFRNHDPFAGTVNGADGIKTGHTREAGYNFLGTVERDGRRLMVVIAGAPSEPARAAASRDLIEWGYANWESRPLAPTGARIGRARVQQGASRAVALELTRPLTAAIRPGETLPVRSRIVYRGPLVAPVQRGSVVAQLEVRIGDSPPALFPLRAAESVARAGPVDRLVNGLLGLAP